ncbi:MAG: SIMPL domain-containing protein [Candidatus Pacebacteria bacterium]|nr:SIMPL domain-containing protein [Candidatus Paceibacterota bacterium]
MNDINFNSPDPINSIPKSEPLRPICKKNDDPNGVLKLFLMVFSVFLVILSFSIIYNLVSKTQGAGDIVTNEQAGNITVNASATIYVTPNEASVNIGIETTGVSMEEVSLENERKAGNIINKAQAEGVLAEDIKVIEYSIEPQYQKQTTGVDLNQYPEGKVIISFYKIKEVIQIKMPIEKVESVIASALDASATTISDLTFSVKDRDGYVEIARAEAILKAKEKAQKIANDLNVKLSNLISYSDNDYTPVYSESISSSLESTGLNEITVNAYVTYSIK